LRLHNQICATIYGLIAAMCTVGPAFAEELWRGAMVGMTVAQAQKVFPDARPVTNAKPIQDGWVELLQAHTFLDGHRQTIDFLFKDQRLISINTLIGGRDAPDELAPGEAGRMLVDLKKKLGEPVRCKGFNNDPTIGCFWIVGGKFIAYMGRDEAAPMIMLFFHHALRSDAHLLE
jgi:hypothetical protein